MLTSEEFLHSMNTCFSNFIRSFDRIS